MLTLVFSKHTIMAPLDNSKLFPKNKEIYKKIVITQSHHYSICCDPVAMVTVNILLMDPRLKSGKFELDVPK